jgi:molecular chaperone GrpE
MSKTLPNGEGKEPSVEPAEQRGTAIPGTESVSETERLAAELEAKTREIAELNDKYLRALAESENIRKRTRQQSEETVRFQRENLIRDLLPVVDNLERAIQAAQSGADEKSIIDGVQMVLRALLDLLKAHGVTQLNVIGQPFDPSRHESVDHVETGEHPPNTVVSEYHRGYLIGDRMLRPARVAVSKGSADNGRRDERED